jgi:protein FAM32A
MPSSDYAAVSGGALKLKGSNVTKKKKKKPKQSTAEGDSSKAPADSKDSREDETTSNEAGDAGSSLSKSLREEEDSLRQEIEKELKQTGRSKTEAEKRFEEQRRKRLEERLKRDGVKTHKERVEELNRYLSKLSEHHDMYVSSIYVGPQQVLIGITQASHRSWLTMYSSDTSGDGARRRGRTAEHLTHYHGTFLVAGASRTSHYCCIVATASYVHGLLPKCGHSLALSARRLVTDKK